MKQFSTGYWIHYCGLVAAIFLLTWGHDIQQDKIKDLEEIVAHQDQSIDYLLKQDSIAHPQNWKK